MDLVGASLIGYDKTIELLLSKGADVNAQEGRYSNARGRLYGNALQAASFRGHDETVELLLSKGADINAQGGEYGTALQAASFRGHDKTVELLLSKGANVNAQGGTYGNALQEASIRGHDKIVELLLSKGADVNAQGGTYGTALQAASFRGHNKTVELLLSKGADISAQGGRYGNALQAAAAKGKVEVVKMLLKHGASVNAKGGKYENALQAARAEKNAEAVQVLVENGADIDTQGGRYGNAPQTIEEAIMADTTFKNVGKTRGDEGGAEFSRSEEGNLQGKHRARRLTDPNMKGQSASAPDAEMEQGRLLMEGSKPTPETYYYGLQAGLKLIASTIPDALNQTLLRDPTDAGFFAKKHLCTIDRDHQIVSRWENLILPDIRDLNHNKNLVSVNCIRIGVEKCQENNPVIILVLVEPESINENEGRQLAQSIKTICSRSHVTDVDVEIAEMLVPHAAQRAGGSGDPHILEGPFDRNLYIGSSIGPPFNGDGRGSSGTFAAHFTAKRKAAPQDEILLALTCDHVCFDSARPCLEQNLVRRAYKISNSSSVRYDMLIPSDLDREATGNSLRDQLEAESNELDWQRANGDEMAIRNQEEAKRIAERKYRDFQRATRRLGSVFGTGGACVDATTQMPLDWGVILEDLSLDHKDLNKLPPISYQGGANTISAIQKELTAQKKPRLVLHLRHPVAGTLPPGALPVQISRLRKTAPEPNEVFFKVGRTTGWTAGQYNPCRSLVFKSASAQHPNYSDYGWCLFWCFLGIPAAVPFGAAGDSGSLVFDRTGEATGLYFSGFNSIPDISCVISLDVVIKDIGEKLDLTDIKLANVTGQE